MALRSAPLNKDFHTWRSLTAFSVYRIVLALGFVAFYVGKIGPEFLASHDPKLFVFTTRIYLGLSLLSLPLVLWRRMNYRSIVVFMVLVDITALTAVMHASGGPATGLGMLIAVSVTVACLLLGTIASMAIAAVGAMAILGEQAYAVILGIRDGKAFLQAGILGAAYFAMAALAVLLSKRVSESEAAVAASRASLAKLERLNEHIIQYMNTGVLVVDAQNQIQLINHSAWSLLAMPADVQSRPLEDISSALAKQVRHWRRNSTIKGTPFRINSTSPDLMPSFNSLGGDAQLALIFLEDTSKTTQQATQLKLASLGRLTASIAHEIRNPLGALSHAAQLLRESEEISDADQRLVDIIEKNSGRMNNIIENILQISQRRPSQPERIIIAHFLQNFVDDFKVGRNPPPEIKVDVNNRESAVLFDVGQLIQVLTNLCENGIRYSIRKVNRPLLELHAAEDRRTGRPFLDVIDYGEGINPEIAEKMFEPFFTTSSKGLGLGLYLARELCEANRAHLEYLPIPSGGTCFRITFVSTNKTIPQT